MLPPLLDLDGLDEDAAYLKAREEFRRLFLDGGPIVDPLGRRILFEMGDPGQERDDCEHVCYKEEDDDGNRYKKGPRDRFRYDRAARIPWILTALTDPDTRIRASPVSHDPTRQSYTIWVDARPVPRLAAEGFGVFVRPLDAPKTLAFVTAYALTQKKLNQVRDAGPLIYPVKAAKAGKGKKKRRK